MSGFWSKFTKQSPCPACGHSDWLCRVGDRKYICMRVESSHAAKDGGWYHDFGNSKPRYIPPSRPAPPPLKNASELMHGWQLMMKLEDYERLAKSLGVCPSSIMALDAAWAKEHAAWMFPMRDGEGEVIGIQVRGETKKSITGSRLGLFIPNLDPQPVAFLPEGASDTAALLTLGLYAIGRPSCNTGADHLKVALRRLGVRKVVVVADNDEPKENGQRPGIAGALKLQQDLKMNSVVWMPSGRIKDVRQLVHRIGVQSARQMIDDDVSKKIWTMP